MAKEKRESIIDDDTKESILDLENESIISPDQLGDEELIRKQADFLMKVGRNGNKIIEIQSRNLSDYKKDGDDEDLPITSAEVFTLKEHTVESVNFSETRGYVKVNGVDVPLLNTGLRKKRSMFLYDKDEAMSLIKKFNEIEGSKLQEEAEKAEKVAINLKRAKKFMDEVVRRNLN